MIFFQHTYIFYRREIIDWTVEKINAWVYLDLKVHVIPDYWKSLVNDRESWKYIEKKLKGRQMSYLILKCTGKTNYSKVSMYCYIIMNFVSVYPSVDLDDYFV